jgi:uncharacterized protein YbjT (DUF2867 family)
MPAHDRPTLGTQKAQKILVTGATSTIGEDVALALQTQGHAVRALVRSPEKANALRDAGVEVVVGDFDKKDALRQAFSGVDSVLLLTPAHAKAADWCTNAIEVAKVTGSPHVVRISALKASEDGPTRNTRLHGRTDRELQNSGLPFTILRPNYFMQNFSSTVSTLVPAARKWLTADDVAEAIVWSLSQPEHVEVTELVLFPTGQLR